MSKARAKSTSMISDADEQFCVKFKDEYIDGSSLLKSNQKKKNTQVQSDSNDDAKGHSIGAS